MFRGGLPREGGLDVVLAGDTECLASVTHQTGLRSAIEISAVACALERSNRPGGREANKVTGG